MSTNKNTFPFNVSSRPAKSGLAPRQEVAARLAQAVMEMPRAEVAALILLNAGIEQEDVQGLWGKGLHAHTIFSSVHRLNIQNAMRDFGTGCLRPNQKQLTEKWVTVFESLVPGLGDPEKGVEPQEVESKGDYSAQAINALVASIQHARGGISRIEAVKVFSDESGISVPTINRWRKKGVPVLTSDAIFRVVDGMMAKYPAGPELLPKRVSKAESGAR